VLVGTVVGAIPGLGSKIALTILIPFTGWMAPYVALAFFLCISESASFGDTIPAVLFRTPGTAGSAATAIDGYPLAQQGKAGYALGAGAMASFVGAIIGITISILFIPWLAEYVLAFGPPEYFWMAVLGISIIAVVSKGTLAKGIVAGLVGLFISFIGYDLVTGKTRFTFGSMYLEDGIEFIPAMLGLFAVSEMLKLSTRTGQNDLVAVGDPGKDVWKGCLSVFKNPRISIQSSVLGLFIGAIPGAGKAVASFMAYMVAVRTSRHPETFGHGEVQGIIASEAANNASGGGGGALIPTLTLGIPGSSGMALILAGMTFHGIRSGPSFIIYEADMMYAMFAALLVGMVMALFVNLVLIKPVAKAVMIPNEIMVPLILIMAFLGAYALRFSMFDMFITLLFGVLGYFMDRYGYSTVCMVLAMILGPIAEESFFQAYKIGGRSFSIFFTRPISVGLIVVLVLALAGPAAYGFLKRTLSGRRGNGAAPTPTAAG
ncbi:MAG TPA: tripartite tricarboxylate transporter permease, partial [Deferrisomatales bacterium]|nr:tripartite tricarboxylate transporter permease [Deferrisomatales bacterium]